MLRKVKGEIGQMRSVNRKEARREARRAGYRGSSPGIGKTRGWRRANRNAFWLKMP